MTDLKTKVKVLKMSANDKKKYKAGFVTVENDLTDEGRQALESVLREKFDAELTEMAEQIVAEDKDSKK